MSIDTDEIWAALAAGAGTLPEDPRVLGALRNRVVAAQQGGDVEERRQAIEVAAALAPQGGLHWVGRFCDDDDPTIRRRALDIGLAHGEEGLAVVRAFVGDADAGIALDAIGTLTEAGDTSATPRIRALLDARDARVRAAAVHYLGLFAGPVVRPQLAKLAESDPDDEVRATAQVALERVVGARDRGTPTRWVPGSAAAAGPRPPNPEPSQVTPGAPLPPVDASPVPPMARGEDLPSTLPRDPGVLLRLLALAREEDRDRVVDALRSLDPREVGAAIGHAAQTGGDADQEGAAIASRAIGLRSAVSDLRRWLSHPTPAVRAEAARSLGALGGPAILPTIAGAVGDADRSVRLAAIAALAEAAERLGVPHMARTWVAPATHDPDPVVAEAAKVALERLS